MREQESRVFCGNPLENLWDWGPKGKDKLEIDWSTGLGGYRGTLERSGSGELVGKMKEYCDYCCACKRRTGSHLLTLRTLRHVVEGPKRRLASPQHI
jgi:hypothetical protein